MMGKKKDGAIRLSQSARESIARRSALNFEEEDSEYEAELATDRSVDAILHRSNRDDVSKAQITKLDINDFKNSVEGTITMKFAEYTDLIGKAQSISDSGETVLDVSRLKLGDSHIEGLAEGLSKVSPDVCSIRVISVRDNRLSDDGNYIMTVCMFLICSFSFSPFSYLKESLEYWIQFLIKISFHWTCLKIHAGKLLLVPSESS
jgi:hypothetical protein